MAIIFSSLGGEKNARIVLHESALIRYFASGWATTKNSTMKSISIAAKLKGDCDDFSSKWLSTNPDVIKRYFES